MNLPLLFAPVGLPVFLAAVSFLIPPKVRRVRETVAALGSLVVLGTAWALFRRGEMDVSLPWLGMGLDFDLKLFSFNGFILLWIAIFTFLIAVYSTGKMTKHPRIREYYGYLFLTQALANGAVLADNFILFIFFWEGLLVTLYGFITLGSKDAHRTAVKSVVVVGLCDFCMILGIGILWHATGSLKMSAVSAVPEGPAAAGFVLMMIGAIGKAGAMPFHTWIPDAAIDAPTTVMAFLPASLEKLLGIYMLSRICLDFFVLRMNSTLNIVLMAIGSATIVFAVLMALVQKDFKKLLSFHAISQVGYMVLGIGTGVPIGIAGGIFHMLNHAMYKCGLFLTAGSVEHRAGTTELKKLGGMGSGMPVTALGFAVCAAAISGIWPLNGFVSKEMVFHGAFETGHTVFLIAAWIGAIFTLASFLKAGHAIFLGPRAAEVPRVKESEYTLLFPIAALALLCILFGVYNRLPLTLFIEPVLEGRGLAGGHPGLSEHALDLFNPIAGISMLCLVIALGIHLYGWNKAQKKAYLASEPIHNLPVLKSLYAFSEARWFDLYEQGTRFLRFFSKILSVAVDRPIDYFFEKAVTATGAGFSRVLRLAHNGHYANYLAWCIAGLLALVWGIRLLL